MNCPLCLDETLNPNFRDGIEVDVCPRCRGVWLDRGELDKLVATSPPSAPPARSAPASPAEDRRPPKQKKAKKQKSTAKKLGDLLEDILDL